MNLFCNDGAIEDANREARSYQNHKIDESAKNKIEKIKDPNRMMVQPIDKLEKKKKNKR